uniref:Putative gtp-binding protein rem n=1 Tax=Triatoma infestans TaxID=30076 RepID=A0A023F2Y1_TRIIF
MKTSLFCTGQQTSSRQSSCVSCPTLAPHKVLMLGSSDVGKTSLISQFMTSEFLHAYDNSIDEEAIDKSISVLLDGEETELVFVDHPYSEMSPTTCLETYKSTPAAFCVVYSTADKASFKTAEKALQQLWKTETVRSKAVILVANKADLVRSRVVSSQEGKRLATSYDCKYIETSVGFNHNVDELLVGIVSQVRLKQDLTNQEDNEDNNERKQTTAPRVWVKTRNTRTSASLKVKGLLSKVWASHSKSKSCENLHVL